jgi:hypothetical protein
MQASEYATGVKMPSGACAINRAGNLKGPPAVCSSGPPGSKFVGIKNYLGPGVLSYSRFACGWSLKTFSIKQTRICCDGDAGKSASLWFSWGCKWFYRLATGRERCPDSFRTTINAVILKFSERSSHELK